MTLDIHVRSRPDIRAEIWLRVDPFEKATTLVGANTDLARAELVDLSDRQLRRAKSQRVGDQAVANILVGLRRAGIKAMFEDFFELREIGHAA